MNLFYPEFSNFLQGGVLVHVIRGANPPEITKHIKEKLALEKKILSGEAERTPVCLFIINFQFFS